MLFGLRKGQDKRKKGAQCFQREKKEENYRYNCTTFVTSLREVCSFFGY